MVGRGLVKVMDRQAVDDDMQGGFKVLRPGIVAQWLEIMGSATLCPDQA